MKFLLLVLLSLACATFAGAEDKAAADKDKVAMVEYFLKTPVADLPSDHIDEFIAIDPEILPKKLRKKFAGKKFELLTFKRLAEGKKKGTIRSPEADCDTPKDNKSSDIEILKLAGYEELFDDDLICVEKETKCTPHDLACEFSLQIIAEDKGKGKKKVVRFFMHKNDMMMGIVAGCRGKNGVGKQTNFFGTMKPLCQH